jgi:hypothetical protein
MWGKNPLGEFLMSDWITAKVAAELIGVTPHQARHLARKGIVEACKFGHA